jgi:hypothetical protein
VTLFVQLQLLQSPVDRLAAAAAAAGPAGIQVSVTADCCLQLQLLVMSLQSVLIITVSSLLQAAALWLHSTSYINYFSNIVAQSS